MTTTRIVFLTRSLDAGGAERQLVTLVTGLNKANFHVSVICFYAGGSLQRELETTGIEVIVIGKRSRWDVLPFLLRLFLTLRRLNPDFLYGFLILPNILAACSKLFLSHTRVIFGVRSAYVDLRQYDWLYRLVARIERFLSRFADLVVVNSNPGKDLCIRSGFPPQRIIVIPNGIDSQTYIPDRAAGELIRQQWEFSTDDFVIGLVGRIDPMKDHMTFLQAAALTVLDNPNVHFVCVGDGPDAMYNQRMYDLSDSSSLQTNLVWAGERRDMLAVYNALDVCCNSSYGEGFPNAICEAMACGVPCVVTDVGDSAFIVGDTGLVVPPKDPRALADAFIKLAQISEIKRHQLGEKVRQRIETAFTIPMMVAKTEKALLKINENVR